MYVYVYVYVCMHVYVRTYVHKYNVCVYVCLPTCTTYTYMSVCVHYVCLEETLIMQGVAEEVRYLWSYSGNGLLETLTTEARGLNIKETTGKCAIHSILIHHYIIVYSPVTSWRHGSPLFF